MVTVLLTARIIAAIYIVAGVATLMGRLNFMGMVDELEKSPALTFICGAIGIAAGGTIITFHNVWAANLTVVITLIGWMFLMGGVAYILFPKIISFCKKSLPNERVLGFLMILFGFFVAYVGYSNQ